MMKITEIRIKNYRQFRNFHLSLRHPDTQAPLEKVCLIGSNGTGKSTLLQWLSEVLQGRIDPPIKSSFHQWDFVSLMGGCIQAGNESTYFIAQPSKDTFPGVPPRLAIAYFPASIQANGQWENLWLPQMPPVDDLLSEALAELQLSSEQVSDRLTLKDSGCDLLIYASPDGSSQLRQELPQTTLNQALPFFDRMPAYHHVSYENVAGFWNVLIYQIKRRESEKLAFWEAPETQQREVAEARRLFDETHPEILTELAKQWNLILERAGLEFDLENAKIPVQLNENLLAYIRSRHTPDQPIPYNQLSTGIRNLIFRLGHIYSLYFNRQIDRGFLLIDEPELSLFPDLLYDIIDRYLAIIQNTQMFVATHSPIIAGQFEPYERIILEFDDRGFVSPHIGISPAGDDPNDLLVNDFGVRSLYGHKGIEQWNRFLELRQLIHDATDAAQKKAWLDEYMRIGNAYNFAPDEISR
jgi:predicted ATP-binding protein involved in virulence